MRQVIVLSVDGRQRNAQVWPIEKVPWEGGKIKCPHCKEWSDAKAVIDILQYGLIDHDLCYTLFDCPKCEESFGVEYSIDWSDESKEEKRGKHNA